MKVTPGSGPGSGIEQRRENDQEDKIGIEGDVRYAGNEAEKQPADDHDDWVRRPKSSGKKSEKDDKKQQQKKDELDFSDFTHLALPTLMKITWVACCSGLASSGSEHKDREVA